MLGNGARRQRQADRRGRGGIALTSLATGACLHSSAGKQLMSPGARCPQPGLTQHCSTWHVRLPWAALFAWHLPLPLWRAVRDLWRSLWFPTTTKLLSSISRCRVSTCASGCRALQEWLASPASQSVAWVPP